MNTKQIAEEARKSLCRMFDECNRKAMGKHHTIYFPAPEAMDAIIQAAIEKATEEGVEIGSMLMAGAVVKAFTEGGRFGFTDENDPRYKLNQILDSRAAQGSEQGLATRILAARGRSRHHYQSENGFPCPCGKPIDDPIHIPRINP